VFLGFAINILNIVINRDSLFLQTRISWCLQWGQS
jgi:hypothetical protein